MRQFAGILCTQLLYLAYSQKGNKTDGVKRQAWNDGETGKKEKNRPAPGCHSGIVKEVTQNRYEMSSLQDSDIGSIDDLKKRISGTKHLFIGNKHFKQVEPVHLKISATVHQVAVMVN